MTNEKLLLSPNEAAMVLGVGRSLVYSLLNRGDLMSLKIGRARRIPRTELEAFVARMIKQQNESGPRQAE